MKRIIIDTLGGDNGENEIVLGAIEWMKNHQNYDILFVGHASNIISLCKKNQIPEDRYLIIDAMEEITNLDNPMSLLHDKENTSMVKALTALNDENNIGLFSCGSTGCLLVGSIFKIGLFKGLRFPFLAAELIKFDSSPLCLTDCGANIDVKENDLLNIAKAGSAYIKSLYHNESPRVGLLSVGKEDHKGNEVTKKAFNLLKKADLNFIGNIEGNDVFKPNIDVVVCDGFVGNIILKNAESVAYSAMDILDKIGDDPLLEQAKIAIYKRYGYNSQGGSIFLGTKEIIIKGHGVASSSTVISCIDKIVKLYENNFISLLEEEFN